MKKKGCTGNGGQVGVKNEKEYFKKLKKPLLWDKIFFF